MTYNVFGGTLNLAQQQLHALARARYSYLRDPAKWKRARVGVSFGDRNRATGNHTMLVCNFVDENLMQHTVQCNSQNIGQNNSCSCTCIERKLPNTFSNFGCRSSIDYVTNPMRTSMRPKIM